MKHGQSFKTMATKISGTNTAASPAITGDDTDTGLSFGTDTVNISTGGSTRATVDADGDLGIGTTSPSHKLHVVSSGTDTAFFKGRIVRVDGAASSDSPRVNFSLDGTDKTSIMCNRTDNTLNIETLTSSPMIFRTNSTERARIDSGGRMLVNSSSSFIADSKFEAHNGGGNVGGFYHDGSGNNYPLIIRNNRCDAGTTGTLIHFVKIGGSEIGSIRANGSSTSYLTSSDYRLKENVTPISDGITRLKTLKPSRFNFKADKDTTVDGFLAHEVTAVPEATTGTKDEVATEDSTNFKKGDPIYQTIDQSKLVPLLTAALQEAITKIETLETKVAALEAA